MLERIEVKNFKSLKHLNYKCAQLNLLTGVNGSGKSSFVQLLLFLRSIAGRIKNFSVEVPLASISEGDETLSYGDLKYCYASSKDPISFSVDFSTRNAVFVPFDEDSSGSISRVIVKSQNDQTVRIMNPEAIRIDADFKRAASDYVYFEKLSDDLGDWVAFSKDNQGDMEVGSTDPRYKQLEEHWDSQIKELKRREERKASAYAVALGNLKMVSAFRERPHEVHKGGHFSGDFSEAKVALNPEGMDVVEFISKCGAKEYLFYDKKNPMILSGKKSFGDVASVPSNQTTLLEQLQLWLNVVSPGAKIFVESIKVGGLEQIVMSVGFGGNEKDMQKFKPQNVGFGISYVLPVLVTLLVSRPGDTVIIENPEAHLHPRGQSAMGNLLARAAAYGIQLFVETHSDHVINGMRVAVKNGIVKPSDVNIAFFERKGHDVMGEDGAMHKEYYAEERDIKIDSMGSLSEYPEDFMDEWDNQLMELLK